MLTAEAQKSVEEAVGRLSSEGTPFHITDINIDVRIDGIKVAAGRAPRSRKPKARARKQPAGPSRGRRTGAVRSALLDAFEGDATELTTEQLQARLKDLSVEATPANVHQHLARLVKAGELVRAGRGVYRRGAATTS